MATKIQDVVEEINPRKAVVGTSPYIEIGDIDIATKEIRGKGKGSVLGAVFCPPNSIIVSKVRPDRGAIALVRESVAVSNGFAILKVQEEKCLPEYLFHQLAWNTSFLSFLQSRATGATYPTVKEKDILSYEIGNLPSISEQRRIISTLSGVEELQTKRRQADQKTEQLLFALFSQTFGDFTRWSQKSLDEDVAIFRYGTSVKCDYDSSGVTVLRIPNILGGQLNLHDVKYAPMKETEIARLTLKKGDVLFVRTNGNPEYVGRCAVFDIDGGKYTFASYLIRARLDMNKINPWFLSMFLQTQTGRATMARAIRTTAGQSNINIEGLRSIVIPMPPIELQNEFAEALQKIKSHRDVQTLLGEKIDALRNAFLGQFFSSANTVTSN